ncbi:MAG: phenylacetate--CoA ligase family protein [Candidatus Thorarchaeota archaeon]|jgi:phenylacetate-CoA ligase
MIRFCYDFIPYYRRKLKMLDLHPIDFQKLSDIEMIPPIDKSEIIENKKWFYPQGFGAKYDTRSTGGTTGTSLSFRVSHRVRFLSAALIYRSWAAGGYSLGDRMLFFAGSSLVPRQTKTLAKFAIEFGRNIRSVSSFEISASTLGQCLDHLNTWKPPFLRGYPSSIVELARFIDEKGLDPPPLEAIFTTSENLHPPARKKIESVFGPAVYDGYGANDGGAMSFECERKNMHICTERSLLEVVDENDSSIVGEAGRILSTDLENYVMPLIRYDIGDDAIASERECSCGRGLPLLDSLIGRTVSVFTTPSGKLIHGWFFLYMFWEFGESVRDYKVTQKTVHDIEILIVPGTDFDNSIIDTIRELISKNCREWFVEISLVAEIPKTSSAKKIFIESRIERNHER